MLVPDALDLKYREMRESALEVTRIKKGLDDLEKKKQDLQTKLIEAQTAARTKRNELLKALGAVDHVPQPLVPVSAGDRTKK